MGISIAHAHALTTCIITHDSTLTRATMTWRSALQIVIWAALHDAGAKPRDVAGLQLHGTGTGLGDPIEAGSAAALFQQRTDPDRARPSPPGDLLPAQILVCRPAAELACRSYCADMISSHQRR